MRMGRCVLLLAGVAAALLLHGVALAASQPPRHCPRSPDNVPRALVPSAEALRQRISTVGGTLIIAGTPNPDHILIKGVPAAGWVRVIFDGLDLGRFGPAAEIVVRADDGNDVVIVEPQVMLPARLEGGAGDDCLQGGIGPDVLLGGDGDDTLIATRGRDALHGGGGTTRIAVASKLGEIRITPSVESPLRRHLGSAYTLRALRPGAVRRAASADGGPSPIIIGPADLADPRVAPHLREAYAAGQAVAITGGSAEHAAALRELLGYPAAADGRREGPGALLFFRKTGRVGGRGVDYSAGTINPPPPTPRRDAAMRTIELLSRAFSTRAIVPEPPTDSPENSLLNLADSFTSSVNGWNGYYDQIHITNSVWSLRTFDQKEDLYYVRQEVDYFWAGDDPNPVITWTGSIANQLNGAASVLQPSPSTTECVTTLSSSVSYSAGGSLGWNQTQGLNAALSGGMSVTDTQSITCPPISISNQTNPGTAQTGWQYVMPGGAPVNPGVLQTFFNLWISVVPFSSYGAGQKTTQLSSSAGLVFECSFTSCTDTVVASLQSAIPLPFGNVFALEKPVVQGVSPTCVDVGSSFTIAGTGMYPSLVTAVLIDGSPLDPRQYTVTSDTAITVIAPKISGDRLPVVVQTQQGESNDGVTIKISPRDRCN